MEQAPLEYSNSCKCFVDFIMLLDYTGTIHSPSLSCHAWPNALRSCELLCFDRRGWGLTSWLLCSMAKSSSQDLYSSMPSAVLRTNCGLNIRHGSPRCKTDSTAVAQLLSVILPVGESHGDRWNQWLKTCKDCHSQVLYVARLETNPRRSIMPNCNTVGTKQNAQGALLASRVMKQ